MIPRVLTVYTVMRSMIAHQIVTVMQRFLTGININAATLINHVALGSKALMEEVFTTIVNFNIIRDFLLGLTNQFRNDLGEETFYAWTGENTSDHLHLTFSVDQPREHIQLPLPAQANEEVTQVRASKLQWLLINLMQGIPMGMRAVRFLEYCAGTGLADETIRDQNQIKVTFSDVLGALSDRPTMQFSGNIISYITDKVIEYTTFQFVRYKLRPSQWAEDLAFDDTVFDIDATGLEIQYRNWHKNFEYHQVKCEAAQGKLVWYMLPFCGMSMSDQSRVDRNDGNPPVQLTRIHRDISAWDTVLWFKYRPRQANAFDQHVNVYLDKHFNKVNTNAANPDGAYFTIIEVTPPVFSLQVPQTDIYRERPDMWGVYANLTATGGVLTFPSIVSDFIGLKSVASGYWYAVSCHLTQKFGFTKMSGKRIVIPRDDLGKPMPPQELEWKASLPNVFELKDDDLNFSYPIGVNLYDFFVQALEQRKKWDPIDESMLKNVTMIPSEKEAFIKTLRSYDFAAKGKEEEEVSSDGADS